MKQTILLTGATGFIARNLRHQLQEKHNVSAPTRAELNLLNVEAVEAYLRDHRFDVVIHAANTNNVVHPEHAAQMLDFNLRMFYNLERCSQLYGKLYYFGSGAEYDLRHYVPRMTEEYFGKHIPADPYGFSKYIMSKAAKGNIYDLRLFGVFGPHEEWRRRFISNMIYQALSYDVMRMDRNMYFDYLYVNDLAKILEWFLHHDPRYHHYNVCTGEEIDLLSLARIVREETGSSAEIMMNGTEWKLPYTGSNARLLGEIGDFQFTPIRTAVREMVVWYRENGFS